MVMEICTFSPPVQSEHPSKKPGTLIISLVSVISQKCDLPKPKPEPKPKLQPKPKFVLLLRYHLCLTRKRCFNISFLLVEPRHQCCMTERLP